ncbi:MULTISPECIES: insulinase family protein [Cryobacterium]|nr:MULTISPECIES: insulinase family protein [Cryobacterium]
MTNLDDLAFGGHAVEEALARNRIRSQNIELQIRAMVQDLTFPRAARARLPSAGPGNGLLAVSAQEVRDYSATWLTMERAALIVVGDDVGTLISSSERRYRRKSAPALGPRRLKAHEVIGGRNAFIDASESRPCRIVMSREVPGSSSEVWQALKWIGAYLASEIPGSLNTVLRADSGLTYGTSSQLAEFGCEASWMFTFTTPVDRVGEALALAKRTIENAGAQLQKVETLREVGRILEARSARPATSNSALAYEVAQSYFRNGPESIGSLPRLLAPPDSSDIAEAAARWLPPDQLNVLAIGALEVLNAQLGATSR